MEILVVDGYNVINAWPGLASLTDNLALARAKLVDILLEYGAYKDFRVIVVFDAHISKGQGEISRLSACFEVIYTKKNETADSRIEKMVYHLVKEKERVYVVTSDWAEQMTILGLGAFRISARELLLDVSEVKKQIRQEISEKELFGKRHELANRLEGDLHSRLDAMRRANKGKNK